MELRIFIYCVLIFVFLSGCTDRSGRTVNNENEVVRHGVEFADRFRIQQKDGYTILTIINPWQGATDINQVYYLLKNGMKLSAGIDTFSVIHVPVRKIVCMSTTHLAMIYALNEEQTIRGVSGADFVYEARLSRMIENGQIADVGYEDNLNKELVIQISPDLVMVYGIGSESAGYLNKIKEMGVRVIFNADYLETDPLGKAEWIKVFGALYCREKEANDLFASITENYNRLKSYVLEKTDSRPSVLLGLPYKDTWYVSPGNSYISKLISDAGGNYLWKDTYSDISMPFGIENVYIRALKADFWLNISNIGSSKDISAVDMRLCELPCYKNRKMYNNINRIATKGGNDYWESGCINPHIILKDIASILHPDLFHGYEMHYYRKIE